MKPRSGTECLVFCLGGMLAAALGPAGCSGRGSLPTRPDGGFDAAAMPTAADLRDGWVDAEVGVRSSPDADAMPEGSGSFCSASRIGEIVGQPRDEIDGAVPKALWVKKLTANVGAGQLVMTADDIAITVGNGLVIYSKASGALHSFSGSGSELFGGVIARADGGFLLAARNAYEIGRDGSVLWSLPLGQGRPIGNEWSQCRLSYSSSKDVLLAVCNDGVMYGISASGHGSLRWQKTIYTEGAFDVYPTASAGDIVRVAFPERYRPSGTWAIDAISGERLGIVGIPEEAVWSFNSSGYLARASALTLLDGCGRPIWKAEGSDENQIPMVVGLPDERIFMLERSADDTWKLGVVSSQDGRRLAGPVASGTPIAAGADSTLFAVTCDNGNPGSIGSAVPPELVAYSSELREKWRVAIPVPAHRGVYLCPRAGVALGHDGVMYLAAEADGTYLIAIQTRSPGVAMTTWPLRFRGHNGSLWLD